MQYTVTTTYAGSIQLSVEADNEEQACDLADDQIDEMDASTFLSEVELQSMGQNCCVEKPVAQVNELTKHPIASIPELEMAASK